jgi:DNA-directed RNA polymerase specialized sigma24 family protein
MSDSIEAIMAALPWQTRMVENLTLLEGHEPDAVGRMMGLPLTGVRRHLVAARAARMAAILDKHARKSRGRVVVWGEFEPDGAAEPVDQED